MGPPGAPLLHLAGEERVVVRGKFEITVPEANARFLPSVEKILDWADEQYTRHGVPLGSGPIKIRLSGKGTSSGRSIYSLTGGNFIGMTPSAMKREDLGTFIHELAHWYHANRLPGGFRNKEVIDKYVAVGGTRRERPSEDSATVLGDTPVLRRGRMEQELKMLQNQYDALVASTTLRRGMVFEEPGWANPFVKTTPYTRQYKLLSTAGKFLKAELLNPSDWDKGPGGRRGPPYIVNDLHAATVQYKIKSPEQQAEQRRLREAVAAKTAEIQNYAQTSEYQTYDAQGGQYDVALNEWVPSDYARKNHKEWFAELLAMKILRPGNLSEAVQHWIAGVVR